MDFQTSTEINDLIEALSRQKPKAAGPDFPGRYERTITFIHPDDAEKAKSLLAELLPEPQRPEIKLKTAIDIDLGTRSYRLTVPSSLVPPLKRAILASSERGDSASHSRTGFVASLDARSTDGNDLRQMPDDPENPKKSVNNFLAPLGGLERAFDLCERLDYARERHAGNKHKYYASTGSYGLRFDSREDADNAKAIFGAIIHDGAAMEVDEQVVSHKPHFWLKVPGEMAVTILSEAGTLKDMREEIGAKFQAGNIEQATQAREEMLALVTEMGLGGSHVAEQMTREVLFDVKDRVR